MSFEGRFSTEKAKEALVLEQKNKASDFRKYALTGFEVKEILDEFVGKQLTTHMGELILQKVGQLPGAGAVYCEKRAVKRILDKNTEANTFTQNVAKVRKESEDEKTGDCLRTDISKCVQPTSTVCIEGTEYAGVFPSMKVIVFQNEREC